MAVTKGARGENSGYCRMLLLFLPFCRCVLVDCEMDAVGALVFVWWASAWFPIHGVCKTKKTGDSIPDGKLLEGGVAYL